VAHVVGPKIFKVFVVVYSNCFDAIGVDGNAGEYLDG
jgi:hypothetical protein